MQKNMESTELQSEQCQPRWTYYLTDSLHSYDQEDKIQALWEHFRYSIDSLLLIHSQCFEPTSNLYIFTLNRKKRKIAEPDIKPKYTQPEVGKWLSMICENKYLWKYAPNKAKTPIRREITNTAMIGPLSAINNYL